MGPIRQHRAHPRPCKDIPERQRWLVVVYLPPRLQQQPIIAVDVAVVEGKNKKPSSYVLGATYSLGKIGNWCKIRAPAEFQCTIVLQLQLTSKALIVLKTCQADGPTSTSAGGFGPASWFSVAIARSCRGELQRSVQFVMQKA